MYRLLKRFYLIVSQSNVLTDKLLRVRSSIFEYEKLFKQFDDNKRHYNIVLITGIYDNHTELHKE